MPINRPHNPHFDTLKADAAIFQGYPLKYHRETVIFDGGLV